MAAIICAVAGFAAYYCHRLPVYKRTHLIIDDSPFETPRNSPTHKNSQVLLKAIPSSNTLTEVLSMKSLRTGIRRESNTSYEPLNNEESLRKARGGRRSLPASPFLTRHAAPIILRRSSTQLGKFFRRGSASLIKQKRRSASFDQLETRCISPIREDTDGSPKNSNKDKKQNKEEMFVKLTKKDATLSEKDKGEEGSKKYKEHRKSLLSSQELTPKPKRRKPPRDLKLKKDKVNLERLRKDVLTRSTSNIRPSSSASEVSMAGTEVDLEYDYYDYDMDNACAVPGSLFGLDPTLMPWLPPFLSISGDSIDETPNDDQLSIKEIFSPDKCEGMRMTELNIPPSDDLLQRSAASSNESNERNDAYDEDITPTVETASLPSSSDIKSPDSHDINLVKYHGLVKIDESGEENKITTQIVDSSDILKDKERLLTPPSTSSDESASGANNENTHKEIKILNVDDLEDFQFADESDDDDIV